ncbi:MAG: universal stress protein, partial [Saprospiraceae bacterium]|nr:universal stress protein [Saprospiraceae bacterium]
MKAARSISKTKDVQPFSLRQLILALALDSTDDILLEYFQFLTDHIPVEGAYFLHILARNDLFNEMIEQETQSIVSNFQLDEEVVAQMKKEIEKSIGSKKEKIRLQVDVREGDPLEELLREDQRISPDLTVIGQKSGTDEHGILANNLIRKNRSDTLVVPESAQPRIARILVPVDFSPHSAKALRMAVAISERFDSTPGIIALNVYEMPSFSFYRIQKTREDIKSMVE